MSTDGAQSAYDFLLSSSQGDIEAFSELFERYSEKLFNFAYYLTYSREDAEDITSETFISVYQAIQGRDVSSFNLQAYLYRTARNASLKSIASRKREGLTMEETLEFKDQNLFSDPERAALLSEQRELVKQTSEELTLDQQSALLLKELEGLPYDTIASILDSNPSAVGALLSRARLKFREAFRMAHVAEPMTDECTALLPLMSKYIDNEASPEESARISAHLTTCPICNENLRSLSEASVTYRSLMPLLPLATFKVWSVARAALAGKAVIAGASTAGSAAGGGGAGGAAAGGAASAEAGAAATAAATAGTAAGLGVMTKILIVAATVLVLGGAVTGGYFTLKATVFAKKTVPILTGMKEAEAKSKVEAAGLKFSSSYKNPNTPHTGNEVVAKQDPAGGAKADEGVTVNVVLEDKDMEAARQAAEKQIGAANTDLQQAQGMGIGISDLAPTMQQAQAKHDGAKTPADYMAPTDSAVYYSNVVIQQCDARKAAYLAEQERQRQIAAAQAAMRAHIKNANRQWAPNMTVDFTSFSMNETNTVATAEFMTANTGSTVNLWGNITATKQGEDWVVSSYNEASE